MCGNKPAPLDGIFADDLIGALDTAAHSLTGQLLILPVERGRSGKRHGSHQLETTPSSMNKATGLNQKTSMLTGAVFGGRVTIRGQASNLTLAGAHREPHDAWELKYARGDQRADWALRTRYPSPDRSGEVMFLSVLVPVSADVTSSYVAYLGSGLSTCNGISDVISNRPIRAQETHRWWLHVGIRSRIHD